MNNPFPLSAWQQRRANVAAQIAAGAVDAQEGNEHLAVLDRQIAGMIAARTPRQQSPAEIAAYRKRQDELRARGMATLARNRKHNPDTPAMMMLAGMTGAAPGAIGIAMPAEMAADLAAARSKRARLLARTLGQVRLMLAGPRDAK